MTRRPRLLLRFALLTGVALVGAVAVGLILARWNAEGQARTRAVGEARAVAGRLGGDDLARTAFRSPPAGEDAVLLDVLDDFFAPTTTGHEPTRVVLYAADGTVTYATDRNLVGAEAADPARVRAAREEPQYAVAAGIQEAYVPVAWAFAPNAAHGVLQLRRDYAPVAAAVHDDFLLQAATTAIALTALYLAMLPIMRRMLRRAQLAAIVEHASTAIIGQSREGLITTWNGGAARIYGWRADEAVGRPIDMLLPAEPPDPDPGVFDPEHTTHVRKDGSPVSVAVTVSPIRDEGGELLGSSVIARDVTELS